MSLQSCFVCPHPHHSPFHLFPWGLEFLLDAGEADNSSQIDTEKLAQLAGFANAKSANASWLLLKKKLMKGATVDAATMASTPKKAKGKGPANGDGDDGEEASPTVSASKKRAKVVKTEPTDTEGGDADTEKSPNAETPKKSRAKKATAAPKTDVTGDASNDTAAAEVVTPTPKRKRGPNKPKDPNATPTKRAKKGAKAGITTTETNDDNATNSQLHAGDSMIGGDVKVKNEDADAGDNGPLDAEEQDMAMLDTHAEDQVA